MLGRGIKNLRIDRREDDRVGPLGPLRYRAGRLAGKEPRVHLDIPAFAIAPVVTGQQAALAPGVEDVRVLRVGCDVARLAAACVIEEIRRASMEPGQVLPAVRRDTKGAVVLLGPADVIGKIPGDGDVVRLSGGKIDPRPALPRVQRDRSTAIVGVGDSIRTGGIDPEIVVVAVGIVDVLEGHATVIRPPDAGIEDVDPVLEPRVRIDPRVVEGPLAEFPVLVGEFPGGTTIVGPEDAARVVLDDGPDPVRRRTGRGHPDLADQPPGQPRMPSQFGPGVAPIDGLEEPAPRPAARHRPRRPIGLPETGIEHVGVERIDIEIHRRRRIVPEENPLPVPATVFRPIDAPLGARRVRFAEGRRVDQIGIHPVHPDPGEGLDTGQPGVLPGLAAVRAPINPVALHDVAAELGLAHADVDHVGIGLRHGHCPNRGTPKLAVGHRAPGQAAVRRLPEAPAHGTEVVLVRPARNPGDRDRPAAPIRTDVPPGLALEIGRIDGVGLGGRSVGRPEQGQESGEERSRHRNLENWKTNANGWTCPVKATGPDAVSSSVDNAGDPG